MFNSFNVDTENINNGKSQPLYCGPIMFRPILFNPNRAELNEFLGSDKNQTEINYHSEGTVQGNVVDSLRVSIWGYYTSPDGVEYKGSLDPIWLKNAEMVSTKDPENIKYCYLNPYGRNTWVKDPKEANAYWYNGVSKKAIWGEQQLMDLLINLLGINTFYNAGTDNKDLPPHITNGETFVKTDKLFAKDYSEIQSLFDRFSTEKTDIPVENPNYQRKLTVLQVIKTRNDTGALQQGQYTGKFGRVKQAKGKYSIIQSDVNQIIKAVNQDIQAGQFNHSGVISDKLIEFDATKPVNTQVPSSGNDVW